MNIYNSICFKNNELHLTEPLNICDNAMAYRVPEDAEYGFLMVSNPIECTYTIKAADNVLGGKDQVFYCPYGYNSMYLDLNSFIQRSGEYKGCVLIEIGEKGAMSEMIVFQK